MLKRIVLSATVSIAVLFTNIAYAGVPVTDVTHIAVAIKNGVVQAKTLAEEIRTYQQLLATYYNDVKNTVGLALEPIQQAQNLYYRATGIANSASRLLASDAPMMQRLSMANGLMSRAGRLPDGTIRSAKWWGDRVEDQWADNRELLGLEEERRAINLELLELSASNGNIATGHMQALQAQHQTMLAMANELQALNANQEQQFKDSLEKHADSYLKDKAYQDFMTQRDKITESAW